VTIRSRAVLTLASVGLITSALTAHPALARSPHAAPTKTQKPGHVTLGDTNGNRIADSLDRMLAHSPAAARHAVVVTFSNRPEMTSARRSVGLEHVSTTFSLIDGFVARLTDGQINAMAHHAGVILIIG